LKSKNLAKTKNGISLSYKIGGGFFALIALCIITFFIGRYAMKIVVFDLDIQNNIEHIDESSHSLVKNEANYRLNPEDAYLIKASELLDEIRSYSLETQKMLTSPDDMQKLDIIIFYANEYTNSFKKYSELWNEMNNVNITLTSHINEILSDLFALSKNHRGELVKILDADDSELKIARLSLLAELRKSQNTIYNITTSKDAFIANLYKTTHRAEFIQQTNKSFASAKALLANQSSFNPDLIDLGSLPQKLDSAYKIYAKMVALEQEKEILRSVMLHDSTQMIDNSELLFQSEQQKLLDSIKSSQIFMAILAIVATVIGLLLTFFITTSIMKFSKETLRTVSLITDGDLTERIKVFSGDELGKISTQVNLLTTKIHDVISEVNESSLSLSNTSTSLKASMSNASEGIENIAGSMNTVTNSVQDVASATEQLTASIQEMASSADIIAGESDNAYESGNSVLGFVQIGAQNIQEVVHASERVHASTNELFETMKELGSASEEIGSIVSLITGISEQTNLLALNAAIEAARAGEHGRGFAVVADEVRKLAEESSSSARKIKTLVDSIQLITNTANSKILEEKSLVQLSAEKSKETFAQFDMILRSVEEIIIKIEGMKSSSKQQSLVAEEMTNAMEDITRTTQENAESTSAVNETLENQVMIFEKVENVGRKLAEMSETLHSLVNHYIV